MLLLTHTGTIQSWPDGTWKIQYYAWCPNCNKFTGTKTCYKENNTWHCWNCGLNGIEAKEWTLANGQAAR